MHAVTRKVLTGAKTHLPHSMVEDMHFSKTVHTYSRFLEVETIYLQNHAIQYLAGSVIPYLIGVKGFLLMVLHTYAYITKSEVQC